MVNIIQSNIIIRDEIKSKHKCVKLRIGTCHAHLSDAYNDNLKMSF